MPRTLDPGVTLRRERERIVLRRRTWRDARLRVDVHPLCAVILALLDGRRTEDEVEHIAAHVFAFTREAAVGGDPSAVIAFDEAVVLQPMRSR